MPPCRSPETNSLLHIADSNLYRQTDRQTDTAHKQTNTNIQKTNSHYPSFITLTGAKCLNSTLLCYTYRTRRNGRRLLHRLHQTRTIRRSQTTRISQTAVGTQQTDYMPENKFVQQLVTDGHQIVLLLDCFDKIRLNALNVF